MKIFILWQFVNSYFMALVFLCRLPVEILPVCGGVFIPCINEDGVLFFLACSLTRKFLVNNVKGVFDG